MHEFRTLAWYATEIALLTAPSYLVLVAVRFTADSFRQWAWSLLGVAAMAVAVVVMKGPAAVTAAAVGTAIGAVLPAVAGAVALSRARRVKGERVLVIVFVPLSFWLILCLTFGVAIAAGWAKL